jgi:hypothetical protein
MKRLILESIATPDIHGYPDRYALADDDDCRLIVHGACSCCPNPTKPQTGAHWSCAYAWADCGEYSGVVVQHPKYGKCILINNGGKIPARFLNPNKKSTCYDSPFLSEVFVHSGSTNEWRGSAGCPTLPPDEFKSLMQRLKIGEKLIVAIVDYSKMKAT